MCPHGHVPLFPLQIILQLTWPSISSLCPGPLACSDEAIQFELESALDFRGLAWLPFTNSPMDLVLRAHRTIAELCIWKSDWISSSKAPQALAQDGLVGTLQPALALEPESVAMPRRVGMDEDFIAGRLLTFPCSCIPVVVFCEWRLATETDSLCFAIS